MKMILQALLFTAVATPSFSQAAIQRTMIVKGVLKSVQDDIATIEIEGKNKKRSIKVPRASVGDTRGYVMGKAVVKIDVPIADFVKLNAKKSSR